MIDESTDLYFDVQLSICYKGYYLVGVRLISALPFHCLS